MDRIIFIVFMTYVTIFFTNSRYLAKITLFRYILHLLTINFELNCIGTQISVLDIEICNDRNYCYVEGFSCTKLETANVLKT